MQQHESLTGVDHEIPFSHSTDEYLAYKFSGPVLLSLKGPLKARIEIHTDWKLLMAFFPVQEKGAYTELWHVNF